MFIAHDPSLGTRAPLGAKYDAPKGLRSEGTIYNYKHYVPTGLIAHYGMVSSTNTGFLGEKETTSRNVPSDHFR